MNNTTLVSMMIILLGFCTTAGADEMTVNLKSGNSLVIQYTGTINSVTLTGETDAITSMKMGTPAATQSNRQEPTKQKIESADVNEANEESGKSSGIRWKWADPKIED